MPHWSTQLTGLLVLVLPLAAIHLDLADVRGGAARAVPSRWRRRLRWRLEVYSNQDGIASALVDPTDVPFPVRRVRSSRGEQARFSPATAWALPRVELEIDVADPFAPETLRGLLGDDHRLRFVTGNEAVVDTGLGRLRIRALETA